MRTTYGAGAKVEPAAAASGDDGGWGEEDEAAGMVGDGPAADVPQLEVLPCSDMKERGVVDVCIAVKPPEIPSRPAADICCVVDISASMSTMTDADGQIRSDRMTQLDIVKHSVKAVIHMLSENDRFTLVAFDNNAETVYALSEMSAAGKENAMAALETLKPRGMTNLWGGILEGLEALRASEDATRQKALLLLTDGQPNIAPPRGHLRELRAYKDKHPNYHFQMNTFGFGYDLDSELLLELAVEGHGTYAFIPDAPIVGTAFVNCLANVLSTFIQSATLHLMPQSGAKLAGPVRGGLTGNEASWGHVINLGPLASGQSRDIIVPLHIPAGARDYLEVMLTYSSPAGKQYRASAMGTSSASGIIAIEYAKMAQMRSAVVDAGIGAVADAMAGRGKRAQEAVTAVAAELAGGLSGAEADGLRQDVNGRMSKALNSKDRFNRWGKHFVRALMRAHQLQLCTNFMDPGLQQYGGDLFKQLRSQGDQAFLALPLPKAAAPPNTLDAALAEFGLTRSTAPWDVVQGIREELERLNPAPAPAPAPARAAATTPRGRTQRRAPAPAPAPPPRRRSPSPEPERYYAGSGGGCFGKDATVVVMPPGGEEEKATRFDSADWMMERSQGGPSAQNLLNRTLKAKAPLPPEAYAEAAAAAGEGRWCAASRLTHSQEGKITPVSAVRPGDEVVVADGSTARVRCVAKIARALDEDLVCLPQGGGLTITPKHPVRLEGRWVMPGEVEGAERVQHDGWVYCFVLERCHVLLVNGVECVTWGHGLNEPGVQHDYYGTNRIIEDLEALPGWKDGMVTLNTAGPSAVVPTNSYGTDLRRIFSNPALHSPIAAAAAEH